LVGGTVVDEVREDVGMGMGIGFVRSQIGEVISIWLKYRKRGAWKEE
jgi:hypothetical protein